MCDLINYRTVIIKCNYFCSGVVRGTALISQSITGIDSFTLDDISLSIFRQFSHSLSKPRSCYILYIMYGQE